MNSNSKRILAVLACLVVLLSAVFSYRFMTGKQKTMEGDLNGLLRSRVPLQIDQSVPPTALAAIDFDASPSTTADPMVTEIKVPKQLWQDLPFQYVRQLENVSVGLMPTESGLVDMPEGLFGFKIHGDGYSIYYQIEKIEKPSPRSRSCSGRIWFVEGSFPICFEFSATIEVKKSNSGRGGFDADAAKVRWNGPMNRSLPPSLSSTKAHNGGR